MLYTLSIISRAENSGSGLACENIRFSSLFAAGDVSRERSPAAKSEEKRMFSQARYEVRSYRTMLLNAL